MYWLMAVSSSASSFESVDQLLVPFISSPLLVARAGYRACLRLAATKSQLTSCQNASTYFGRALR